MAKVKTIEAAAILGVKRTTLANWRLLKKGPRFYRYARNCVVYDIEDLKEFAESRIVETDSEVK